MGTGYFFFFLAAGLFLAALLTLDFLAITLSSVRLTCPRHVSFSEGSGIMRAGAAIVNDRLQPGAGTPGKIQNLFRPDFRL